MIDIAQMTDDWSCGNKSKVADDILQSDKTTVSKILRALKHFNHEIYCEVVEFLIFNRIFKGD